MLKYQRKDLDGNDLTIKVKYKFGMYDDTLYLEILKHKQIFGLTIKYSVHESGKWADRVSHWDCERIEEWVDEELDVYNKQIINERQKNNLCNMVGNGEC